MRKQPCRSMPRNMAVKRPHPRITRRVKLKHDVSAPANQKDIATLWVGWPDDCFVVPLAGSFVQEIHVEAVKMHRMSFKIRLLVAMIIWSRRQLGLDLRSGGIVEEVYSNALCRAHVSYGPLRLKAVVAQIAQQQGRTVIIAPE